MMTRSLAPTPKISLYIGHSGFANIRRTVYWFCPKVTASAGPASADPAQDEDKAKTQAKVDDSQPTANIQVG